MKPGIAGFTHEMESILRSVGRYTRFVSSTKWVLAALAVVLTCMILFYPVFRKDSGLRIAFTSIQKKGAGSPTQMIGAKFHGLDKDNQPFNLVSDTAAQIDDNTVELIKLNGDITLNSGSWLSLSANKGIYKIKDSQLDLNGSIEMFNEAGYEFRTEVMHVDMGKKTAVTHEEVRGQGPLGTLHAVGGATMDNNAHIITFAGPVFVTLYPAQQDAQANQAQTGKEKQP